MDSFEASKNFFDDEEIQIHRVKERRVIDHQMCLEGLRHAQEEDLHKYGLSQAEVDEYFRTGVEPPYYL